MTTAPPADPVEDLARRMVEFERLDKLLPERPPSGSPDTWPEAYHHARVAKINLKLWYASHPVRVRDDILAEKLRRVRENRDYRVDQPRFEDPETGQKWPDWAGDHPFGGDYEVYTFEDPLFSELKSDGEFYWNRVLHRALECPFLLLADDIPGHFANAFLTLRQAYAFGCYDPAAVFCRTLIDVAAQEWVRTNNPSVLAARRKRERQDWSLDSIAILEKCEDEDLKRLVETAGRVRKLIGDNIVHAKPSSDQSATEDPAKFSHGCIRTAVDFVEALFGRPRP